MYMYVCVYVQVCVCRCMHVYVYIYIYVYMCVCVCVCSLLAQFVPFMPFAALMSVQLLLTLLSAVQREPVGKFFAYCFNMFFIRYGEGMYLEASVWARRLAETYCHFALGGPENYWQGLYELIEQLRDPKPGFFDSGPDPVDPILEPLARSALATSTAYALALAGGPMTRDLADNFGAGFSAAVLADDLHYLRWYGNSGAHAFRFTRGERQEPDAPLVACVFRIAISFVSIYELYPFRARL